MPRSRYLVPPWSVRAPARESTTRCRSSRRATARAWRRRPPTGGRRTRRSSGSGESGRRTGLVCPGRRFLQASFATTRTGDSAGLSESRVGAWSSRVNGLCCAQPTCATSTSTLSCETTRKFSRCRVANHVPARTLSGSYGAGSSDGRSTASELGPCSVARPRSVSGESSSIQWVQARRGSRRMRLSWAASSIRRTGTWRSRRTLSPQLARASRSLLAIDAVEDAGIKALAVNHEKAHVVTDEGLPSVEPH